MQQTKEIDSASPTSGSISEADHGRQRLESKHESKTQEAPGTVKDAVPSNGASGSQVEEEKKYDDSSIRHLLVCSVPLTDPSSV